jgi:hypothetical protein
VHPIFVESSLIACSHQLHSVNGGSPVSVSLQSLASASQSHLVPPFFRGGLSEASSSVLLLPSAAYKHRGLAGGNSCGKRVLPIHLEPRTVAAGLR